MVNLFRVYIRQFPIENEFVALDAEANGCFFTQENEGEDVAILKPRQY